MLACIGTPEDHLASARASTITTGSALTPSRRMPAYPHLITSLINKIIKVDCAIVGDAEDMLRVFKADPAGDRQEGAEAPGKKIEA